MLLLLHPLLMEKFSWLLALTWSQHNKSGCKFTEVMSKSCSQTKETRSWSVIIVPSFCLLRHCSVCPFPTQFFSSTSTTLPIRLDCLWELIGICPVAWARSGLWCFSAMFAPVLLELLDAFLVAWPGNGGYFRDMTLLWRARGTKELSFYSIRASLSCVELAVSK